MSKKPEQLINEIEKTPEQQLSGVFNFCHFLKKRAFRDKFDTLVIGESSLKKDWLKPEEDEAWKNL